MKLKHLLSLAAIAVMSTSTAWADLKPTVVVNEDFNDGETTLFTGVNRVTVANDNNVKYTTAGNSTNGFSNATYDFDTDGAAAVKVQFDYFIANANCNYDVAFLVRDKNVAAGHARNAMGLAGSFFAVGRSRQSSVNYFSVNRAKTATASNTNLGLWCSAYIYIDLVTKKVDYRIASLDGDVTIKEETGINFLSNDAASVSQIEFYGCVNSESDYLDNIVITKYENEASHNYTVNAVEGETVLKKISEGIANEGAAYSVSGLSYVIANEGANYKLADAGITGYTKSFSMGTEDQTVAVSYSKAEDIAYFFEAESILSRSYGNANGAYSGGTTAGVNANATLTMPNIAAGTYKITVNTTVRRTNEDKFKVQISTDGETWKDAGEIVLTSNVGGDYSIEGVKLEADGSIRLVEAMEQNMYHYVDYVVLESVYEPQTSYFSYGTESTVGKSYEALSVTVSNEEILAAINAASLDDVTVYAVNPDETRTEDYRDGGIGADGWRTADGTFTNWGNNSVYYVQPDLPAGKYVVGSFPDAVSEPTELSSVFVYQNKTTLDEAEVTITLKYVEPAPAPETYTILKTVDLPVYITPAVAYEGGNEVKFDLADAIATLGVESANKITALMYQPDETYVENSTDGWRNAEGFAAGWNTSASMVCCKPDVAGGRFYDIMAIDATYTEGSTYTAKWALTAGDNAVIYNVNITFGEDPEKKPLTFEVVKTIEIEHMEVANKAYDTEGETPKFSVDEVCEALGIADFSNINTYIVNVTDDKFVENTTDGWRDANGDAAPWASATNGFCLKLSAPASGEFDYSGAHDTNFNQQDTYVAKWAITSGDKAVVLQVNITFVAEGVITGADSVPTADNAVEAIYTAGGAKVSALQPGLNIVKMQNGEVKKVLVK